MIDDYHHLKQCGCRLQNNTKEKPYHMELLLVQCRLLNHLGVAFNKTSDLFWHKFAQNSFARIVAQQ